MLDGRPLVDVHLHAARLPTLKPAWKQWAHDFSGGTDQVYDADGTVVPAAFDAYLAAEGVDIALAFAEYSPKVTGIQPVEDVLPLTAFSSRVRLVANVNPHLHYPVEQELRRQLDLGAVALKIHSVHAGFPANDRAMYPAYALCQDVGVPLVVHCGTSTFPGSMNAYADPILLDDVLRDFRGRSVVPGRGDRRAGPGRQRGPDLPPEPGHRRESRLTCTVPSVPDSSVDKDLRGRHAQGKPARLGPA